MVSGGRKRHTKSKDFLPDQALVWSSTLTNPKSRHVEIIENHPFNQQLQIVFPTSDQRALENAQSLKWETSFYYEIHTKLSLLLSKEFIQEYLIEGTCSMVLKNVGIDQSNTACLVPTGELLLLVDRPTYEQLGIVGKKYGHALPRNLQHKGKRALGQRYLIKINLKSKAFLSLEPKETNHMMDQIDQLFETVDMLLCAYTKNGNPRTINFAQDDSLQRKRVEVNGELEVLKDIFVPSIENFYLEFKPLVQQRDSLVAIQEWLGMVTCGLTDLLKQEQPEPVEPYVSTFTGSHHEVFEKTKAASIPTVRWRGLISTQMVLKAFEKAQQSVKKGYAPWAVLICWGFPDTIVSWIKETTKDKSENEHGFVMLNGSNHYILLFLPKDLYFTIQQLGPHDTTV